MRSRLIGTVIAAAAASGLSLTGLVSPGEVVSTAEPDGLAVAIDALLDDPRLEGAMASVVIRDAATGDTLYERNPGQRLNPASNAKLFTSAAAMAALGPTSGSPPRCSVRPSLPVAA